MRRSGHIYQATVNVRNYAITEVDIVRGVWCQIQTTPVSCNLQVGFQYEVAAKPKHRQTLGLHGDLLSVVNLL